MLEQTGVSLLAGAYFNSHDEGNFCGRLAFVDFVGSEALDYMKAHPNDTLDEKLLTKLAP